MDTDTIKIFVVDSSEVWRKILANHIRNIPDMEVVSEINSSQGSIIMLDEVNPDLVMLAVNPNDRMPVTEVISQLRAINPRIPIILCTDQANMAAAAAAVEKGAQDFITKPYKREIISRCIHDAMAKVASL